MNDQLAKTLGINFIEKTARGRATKDVRISKSNRAPVRYTFSFSQSVAKKLGDYVRVARTDTRIYIAPGCGDAYGWTLTGKKGNRRYVNIAAEKLGFVDGFIGDHSIKYDSDLDVYYITKGE